MKSILISLTTVLTTAAMLSADQFSNYWYSGKAEVVVYDLKQSRYGEVREGKSVLIFVTEPFSKSKHVKLDNPQASDSDHVPVLKLNKTKKYNTGIYPYSIMTSSYADISNGKLLKVSTSVQEWCGHVFMQANAKNDDYLFKGHSYFESEGEQKETLKVTNLEESIFLKLRLNKLKPGKIRLTPSQEQSRMLHIPYEPTDAEIKISEEPEYKKVVVTYDHPMDLKTEIHVGKEFPYHILKWVESFERGGKTHSTIATMKKINLLTYWNMSASKFEQHRKDIGLE